MKEILRKTQQKIYAIWRKAKQHISSFVVFYETNIVIIRITIKVGWKKKEKEL